MVFGELRNREEDENAWMGYCSERGRTTGDKGGGGQGHDRHVLNGSSSIAWRARKDLAMTRNVIMSTRTTMTTITTTVTTTLKMMLTPWVVQKRPLIG